MSGLDVWPVGCGSDRDVVNECSNECVRGERAHRLCGLRSLDSARVSGSARTQVRADAQEAGLSGEEETAYI